MAWSSASALLYADVVRHVDDDDRGPRQINSFADSFPLLFPARNMTDAHFSPAADNFPAHERRYNGGPFIRGRTARKNGISRAVCSCGSGRRFSKARHVVRLLWRYL